MNSFLLGYFIGSCIVPLFNLIPVRLQALILGVAVVGSVVSIVASGNPVDWASFWSELAGCVIGVGQFEIASGRCKLEATSDTTDTGNNEAPRS